MLLLLIFCLNQDAGFTDIRTDSGYSMFVCVCVCVCVCVFCLSVVRDVCLEVLV